MEELVFWQSNLDHRIGRRIWFKSSVVRVAYLESFRKLVTPDMAVTLLNLGPRWPHKVFGRLFLHRKVPLYVRFWPLEKFCNLLRLSLQDYVTNGIGWSEVSGWPSGSQWVAYTDSLRIICFSQWVACT